MTKNVEPYSIVVGIPGKVVKKRFDDEVIQLLLRLQWWNWPEEKIVSEISFLRNSPSIENIKKYLDGDA